MSDDAKMISLAYALSLLPDGDTVHTFLNPAWGLVGASWARRDVIDVLANAKEIHVTGEAAQSMGHGLAVMYQGRWLYIEAANADGAD